MYRLFLFFAVLVLTNITQAQDITYRGLGEQRDEYHTELLQLIFQHADKNSYQVKRYPIEIPHRRAFEFLASNNDIDIVIGYATEERLEKYRGIELPIMKSLNGWRIALVHQDNKNLFAEVKNLQGLQKYNPGLFHTWTDTKIFSANGINVTQGTDYIGLFRMLHKKRFDYYPLSILEAELEAKTFQRGYKLNITIEPNLIIRYPVCFYFYVNKNNQILAQVINQGFENIIANGKFEQLFQQYFGETLKHFLTQQKRTVIDLNNPLLPKSVPLHRKELWLQYQ